MTEAEAEVIHFENERDRKPRNTGSHSKLKRARKQPPKGTNPDQTLSFQFVESDFVLLTSRPVRE